MAKATRRELLEQGLGVAAVAAAAAAGKDAAAEPLPLEWSVASPGLPVLETGDPGQVVGSFQKRWNEGNDLEVGESIVVTRTR